MKLIVADNYQAMSARAADEVSFLMRDRQQPVICTASGDSPAGLYKEILRRVSANELDVSGWFFLGLDEWVGMNGNDEGSCRYHLNLQLFEPLKTPADHICFFDGRAPDPVKESSITENFISRHDGIDVAILGIGMNGHVGMNEPGTSENSVSHVTDLDPMTQQVGQKYFKKEQTLRQGITLGLGTLMKAKNIILLVTGLHKAEIVQRIVEEEISEKLPATILRKHPSVKLFLDAEAASKLIY